MKSARAGYDLKMNTENLRKKLMQYVVKYDVYL